MTATDLDDLVRTALTDLADRFERDAPLLAGAAHRWQRTLVDEGDPAGYFTHPYRFPVLRFPSWVAESIGVELPARFASDLTYSTISGYYFIRLIDDVVDGDERPALLPLAAVYHTEFLAAYHGWFPAQSSFWEHFRRGWYESAGAMMEDATLQSMDEATFRTISARKIAAAQIPAAAVAVYYDRSDLIDPWGRLIRLLGRHEQMLDDVFDWHRDITKGRLSYFLAGAAVWANPEESTEAWVLREGFRRGLASIAERQGDLLATARGLGSPAAERFVLERIELVRSTEADLVPTLASLAALAPYFAPSHPRTQERTLQ